MKLVLFKKPLRPGMLLASICLWSAFVFCSMNFLTAPALAQAGDLDEHCSPSPVLSAGTVNPADNKINAPQTAGEIVTAVAEDTLETEAPKAEAMTAAAESESEDEAKETAAQETVIWMMKKKRDSCFPDGLQIGFDVQPALEKDRLLVPFRTLEAMRAQVSWDNASKTVTAGGGRTRN